MDSTEHTKKKRPASQVDKGAMVTETLNSARQYLKSGRVADADALIATLESKRWGGLKTMRMRAAVQKALSQKLEHGQTLKRIAEDENRAPSDLFRLAAYLIDNGDVEGSRAVAAPLEGRTDSQHLLLNLAYLEGLRSADLDIVRTALFGLLELDVPPPNLPELHIVLRELPKRDQDVLADAIKTKWPDRAADTADGSAARQTAIPQQHAATLAAAGKVSEGQELLATGREADEELRQALALIPPVEARLRPSIEDDGASVIVSPAGSSGTTLMVFTGLADQAMVPIECIDAFCAAEGHSVIYLRDTSRSLFIGGVPALASDYLSSLASLRAMVEELGTTRLLCFGSSAGGGAAIRYGLGLSASGILCASGVTCGRPEFLEEHTDQRARVVIRRLQRSFVTAELDLYEEVAANGGRTPIRLCFGTGSSTDVAHANYLEGLPGVSLNPLEGLNRHGSFSRMMLEGIFQEFIADG